MDHIAHPLTILPLLAVMATVPAQSAKREIPLADHAAWTKAMLDRQNETISRLAQRGAECLPLLRSFFADGDEFLWRGAARTCERIGPAAAPLVPQLLEGLRGSGEWQTQLYAAQALTAIGDAAPAVLEALLAIACSSEVPQLRSLGAEGLEALAPDALQRVLAAADAKRFRKLERAVHVLGRFGDAAVDPMIAALCDRATSATGREVLAEALARRGWQVTRQLERAGLHQLVQRALRTAPLQAVAFAEHFALRHEEPIAPVVHLPRVRWEQTEGSGSSLTLLRAEERPQGFIVSRLCLGPARGAEPSVQLAATTLPRARAADAMRQIELIAVAELERLAGVDQDIWIGAHFDARVHAERDGRTLLEAHFCGKPSLTNLPERFRVEAARNVLQELVHDVEWTPRAADDADHEQLQKALARADNQPGVTAQLRQLEKLVPGAPPRRGSTR